MKHALVIAVCCAGLLSGCGPTSAPARHGSAATAASADAPAPAGARARLDGPQLYALHCAICHGAEGRGDGRAAEFLFPKPRDFTTGQFKLRTTPTGEMPTDDDLLRTITNGIPGSAMPSFAFLPERDRRALIEVVKGFAVVDAGGERMNLFEVRPPAGTVRAGDPPEFTPALVNQGRAVYDRLGCASCHGESGRGDGPSAPTLRDSWGMPIRPANFTRGIYKGGADPRDIYMRFMTGMNGTPMPSFADQFRGPQEAWALVAYIKSLERSERPVEHRSRVEIRARRVREVGAPDPMAEYWNEAAAAEIALMSTWQRIVAPDWLEVRAVHDGRNVAIRLSWSDATVNGTTLRTEDFSDAAAVQFPVGAEEGSFTMGDENHAVNIWQWRMDRQMDLARFQDTEDAHPHMGVDYYPYERRYATLPRGEFPGHLPVPPAPSHDPVFLSGWGAGNPMSDPNRRTAAMNLTARGFGTLETLAPERQVVQARAVWSGGRWMVVFTRSLEAPQGEASLRAGRPTPVAFAVWDGAARDRDGQKTITYWQTLRLE